MSNNSKQIEQRNELHKKLWAIAEKVRGSLDGWDFKNYVLGILFYRFISEELTYFFNKDEKEIDISFDYANLDDHTAKKHFEQGTVDTKGFFILPSELFINVVKGARKNENLNIDLQNVFLNIEQRSLNHPSENHFKGLFDDIDFKSNKLGKTVKEKNEMIVNLLEGINDINFSGISDKDIDVFGDAYEFLISNYASNAGKSGGEYFTPQSVAKLLAQLATTNQQEINKVYDPTCGSGGLLLQMKKLFDNNIIKKGFYGQEKAIINYNLSRMNMFLHHIPYEKFDIRNGDTLLNPLHNDEKPFDVIVSNPPYSITWEGKDNPLLIKDQRYAPAGVLAPKLKADSAFILHCLDHLSDKGKAAIVCFPGVFYRANAEKQIRKYLVDNNYIEAIISLAPNLFYGTSIITNIIVLSKNKNDQKILFINASDEFKKEVNNNILTESNIKRIVDVFKNRREVDNFSKLISNNEINNNNYNLSVTKYLLKDYQHDDFNIELLNEEIKTTVFKINELRVAIDDIVKNIKDVKK